MKKMKFYSLNRILEANAQYNFLIGERSNGKTYAVLEYAVKRYFESGQQEQLAIIRRWEEDFVGSNSARTTFNSLMCNGYGENVIEKLSDGAFNGVEYYGGRYFLTVLNEEGKTVKTDKVIAQAFALTSAEHYKSGSFPQITTILFDEFMTRKIYLPDEVYGCFVNIVSTIIRHRDGVKIFLCGNTVSKYGCVYFTEFGLTNINKMKQGDIDLYHYGESGLVVAVEYCENQNKKGKPSDKYFAFGRKDLKLNMVTKGAWEMDIYPHLPIKYRPKDIAFMFFIYYNEDIILQCEIINADMNIFLFIHRKTTPIKNENRDIVYFYEQSPKINYRYNLLKDTSTIGQRINWFFRTDKVFYQDNEIGEIVRNYLQRCRT